jgi:hypothetical protein
MHISDYLPAHCRLKIRYEKLSGAGGPVVQCAGRAQGQELQERGESQLQVYAVGNIFNFKSEVRLNFNLRCKLSPAKHVATQPGQPCGRLQMTFSAILITKHWPRRAVTAFAWVHSVHRSRLH